MLLFLNLYQISGDLKGDPSNNLQKNGPDLGEAGGLDYRTPGASDIENGAEFTGDNPVQTDGTIMPGANGGAGTKPASGMKQQKNIASGEAKILKATDKVVNKVSENHSREVNGGTVNEGNGYNNQENNGPKADSVDYINDQGQTSRFPSSDTTRLDSVLEGTATRVK